MQEVRRMSVALLREAHSICSFSLVAAVIRLGWTRAGSPGIFG
jgi:hypothetical protein